MIVYLLVATIAILGYGDVRLLSANRPFYPTMAECQKNVATMRDSPPIVGTIACERRILARDGSVR